MDPINDNEKTCKYCNKYLYDLGMNDGNRAKHLQKCSKKVDKSNQNILAFLSNSKTKGWFGLTTCKTIINSRIQA